MVDIIAKPLPEISLTIKDEDGKVVKEDKIVMTGHTITRFFRYARKAIGWENKTWEQMRTAFAEELKALRSQEMEGENEAEPGRQEKKSEIEVDQERLVEAVEEILPDHLRGSIDMAEYRDIWSEALGITLGKIMFARPYQKKTESSSGS